MNIKITSLLLLLNKAKSTFVQDACPYDNNPNARRHLHEKRPPNIRGLASSSTTALISNDVIMLGIHDEGHLNIPGPTDALGESDVGLRYFRDDDGRWYDSTAYGCTCEGFGVSYFDTNALISKWGGANDASGVSNIVGQSISSDGIEARTEANVSDLRVSHYYYPSPETPNLYTVQVELSNIGTNTISELRYRRVMDWDIPPFVFNECVSIFFDEVPSALEYTTDDGFENPNPLDDRSTSGLNFSCPAGEGCPMYDNGPRDHGAMFQFLFKDDDGSLVSLGPGETYSFQIFYGATSNKAEAEMALGAVGAEIASWGFPPLDGVCTGDGSPNVFIFGFKGVGGEAIFTGEPSQSPSNLPSFGPSDIPSTQPSFDPSNVPSDEPSGSPSDGPSLEPTTTPSVNPSTTPSMEPSSTPSSIPSTQPSGRPSLVPTGSPSGQPSSVPSMNPSVTPSSVPSLAPSNIPSTEPSATPSSLPSSLPSGIPSEQPSLGPSGNPSANPSDIPSMKPSSEPSTTPSSMPSNSPSRNPSSEPSHKPTTMPSSTPSSDQSMSPSESSDCGLPTFSPTPIPICDENCDALFYKPNKNGGGGEIETCADLEGLSNKRLNQICNFYEEGLLDAKPAGEICIETCEMHKKFVKGMVMKTCRWLSTQRKKKINRLCKETRASLVCYKTCGTCPADWDV